jgi:glycosyltransferase involved in cell wall biosynthesis
VLDRPIPPLSTPRAELPAATRRLLAQPRRAELDGIPIRYVRFVAPPRPRSYGHWGAWAGPSVAVALRRLRRDFPFDLVHAHNAVPAGAAVRRAGVARPLVVSVHGGDVYHTAPDAPGGDAAVRDTFAAARLVLANSDGIARRARTLGARDVRVVRLGADVPDHAPALMGVPRPDAPVTVVTVGHLVARKRHADVLRALWLLRDRHPTLRYLIVGDGPERAPLEALTAELGLGGRVTFAGQLDHEAALARMAREGAIFAMPSTDEALGVAYLEAMAAGLPTIAAAGEPGPREIASAGEGLVLVPPADVEALAAALDALAGDAGYRHALGAEGRATVRRAFTWERCGAATVAAYEEALRR